jgi:hypothetical protein
LHGGADEGVVEKGEVTGYFGIELFQGRRLGQGGELNFISKQV